MFQYVYMHVSNVYKRNLLVFYVHYIQQRIKSNNSNWESNKQKSY